MNFLLPATLEWSGDAEQGCLRLLDQTLLPHQVVVLELTDVADAIDAIRRLAVRGAPALGVAAAFSMVLGVRAALRATCNDFDSAIDHIAAALRNSRPTAVNLAWAVERVAARGHASQSLSAMLDEARSIQQQDQDSCRRIGEYGADLIKDGMTVLTHCNAGRLATAGDGTALSILFAARASGRSFRVLADETRPLLQGARLTALELAAAGIAVEVIVDSAAAGLMAAGKVDLVVTGADRIARNGDVANKVGTYGLALAAAANTVPMYVAAPASTFDLSLSSGAGIPIEERDPSEVLTLCGEPLAAKGIAARNPAFDITPAHLLTGLVTDFGRIEPVDMESIRQVMLAQA